MRPCRGRFFVFPDWRYTTVAPFWLPPAHQCRGNSPGNRRSDPQIAAIRPAPHSWRRSGTTRPASARTEAGRCPGKTSVPFPSSFHLQLPLQPGLSRNFRENPGHPRAAAETWLLPCRDVARSSIFPTTSCHRLHRERSVRPFRTRRSSGICRPRVLRRSRAGIGSSAAASSRHGIVQNHPLSSAGANRTSPLAG